nr:PREDICTED: KN motif and ankyrin repeat domain-containing protein 3 [Lepisosteus oculatus]
MTQSVQLNQKLPDVGTPFLYSTQEEGDQGGSYSVQTPYGFQLDLDFLKYVEEIESGHNFRRAPVNPRRGPRSSKSGSLSRRSPGAGGHTSGWTSTESLSSSASEEGRVPPVPPPRNRTISAPSESLPLSPVPLTSPPLSAGPRGPPPPPIRNPRVERTLLETSRRLEQEQSHLQNGSGFQLAEPPRAGSKQLGRVAINSSQPSPPSAPMGDPHPPHLPPSSPSPSQVIWPRASPQNSGRSTPASGGTSSTGLTQIPPNQLQTVREQMAAALRQLKEMEERVKGVPALEREVAKLRAEKEELQAALREKVGGETGIQQRSLSVGNCTAEEAEGEAQRRPPPASSHVRQSKIAELRKLTERLGGREDRNSEQVERTMVVERKSVGVGGDRPLEEGVFYYRKGTKEVAVGTEAVEACEKGVGTDARETRDAGAEARAEVEDASVWVMESLLGLRTEAEREIETLQDTIKFQQETIQVLESSLSQVDKEMEALRVQDDERKSKVAVEKGTQARPEMASVLVEAVVSLTSTAAGGTLEAPEHRRSIAVECRQELKDVGVGREFVLQQINRDTQTESRGEAREAIPVTSTGSQWEKQDGPETGGEQKAPVAVLKRRQVSITGHTAISSLGAVCVAERRKSKEVIPVPLSPAAGVLKSIMKRKDGSTQREPGSRKSLQFVGVLNGGYESTSSEEEEDGEEEEGTSSGGSGGGGSDSSEGEDGALIDTSEDERNVNLDDSDSEGEEPAAEREEGQQSAVKEKFELSKKMREACLILKNHLNDDINALKSKEVLSSTHTVQQEWFRVSSAKTALPSRVADYLMAFSEVSPALLRHVVNMTDSNGNTALHYSVSHSNFTVVGLLLDTGVCNVDHQNKAGYTAIMLAALAVVKEEEDMRVVRKLFSLGSVNAKASQVSSGGTGGPRDGSNALSIALEASHNDIAVLLYAHMNYSNSQAAGTSKITTRSHTS